MRYLYFLILSGLILSCNNESHKTISDLIGKEIIIPENLAFKVNGTIVDPELVSCDYTIITYLDSTGCTTCRMNLDLWKEALNDLLSVTNAEVDFIMLFNSTETDDIKNAIYQQNFLFPVSFDCTGEFERVNSLPQKDVYHTFLVDSEYNILAVGNPSLNPKVLDLYKQIINDGEGSEDKHLCRKRVKALGVLNKPDTVKITFNLVNSDSVDYHIQSIVPSCDCININASTDIIGAGLSEEFAISFKPDSTHSRIHKSINIFFHEKSNPETIVVLGYLNKSIH